MIAHEWLYRLKVGYAYDGDTLKDVEVDLGFRTYIRGDIRLLGVWAPELKMVGGIEARDFVQAWIDEARLYVGKWPFVMRTVKKDTQLGGDLDSLSRYLGVVYRELDNQCLNEILIAKGYVRQ